MFAAFRNLLCNVTTSNHFWLKVIASKIYSLTGYALQALTLLFLTELCFAL